MNTKVRKAYTRIKFSTRLIILKSFTNFTETIKSELPPCLKKGKMMNGKMVLRLKGILSKPQQ